MSAYMDSLLDDLEHSLDRNSSISRNRKSSEAIQENIQDLDNLLTNLSHVKKTSGSRIETITTQIITEKKTTLLPKQKALVKELKNDPPRLRDSKTPEYVGAGIWNNNPNRSKASNATQELDELMDNLNVFKIKENCGSEEPLDMNLDAMLGNLKEDMDKAGVRTKPKGSCYVCSRPIVGQIITALGQTWHPEHFTCAICNQELGTKNFFEREGKLYCESDYQKHFGIKCEFCKETINDKVVVALGKNWHSNHFNCFSCSAPFGEDGFREKDDQAFCSDCYHEKYSPKCAKCSQVITQEYVSCLNAQWHWDCFSCFECNLPFADGNYFEIDGKPYCETHYYAIQGSLCAGCNKAISGRCLTAMFRKFHPEHFVCSFCLKQLNKGTFKEQGDKPYCHDCFDRLFG